MLPYASRIIVILGKGIPTREIVFSIRRFCSEFLHSALALRRSRSCNARKDVVDTDHRHGIETIDVAIASHVAMMLVGEELFNLSSRDYVSTWR